MSFMLPSVTASTSPGKPAESSAAQHNAQEPEAADSFGQALSRALAPAGEAADRPGAKAAAPAAAKRQPADDKTDPPALLNAAALALVPPAQDPVLPAALARDGLAATANTSAVRTASAPLTESQAAAATDLPALAAEPVPSDPGARAPTALAPALMAASHTGQTLPQARLNAADADIAPALAPGHAPAPAPDTGTSDPSSQAEDQAPQAPVITLSVARATPAAAPADEATALPVNASQAPAADSANPDAALALGAATAMAPGGASVAASNAALAAPASPLLAPEVGSGEWGKALGQQVVHLGQAGQQQAELQLNPPGLGPLKVTLSLNDHQIQAMFVSAHASVRAAVEAALPQLRATLADNGISLGNTSVSADNQQQAAFSQEQNRQPNQRAYPNSPMPSMPASLSPRPLSEPLRQQHGITVDTYA